MSDAPKRRWFRFAFSLRTLLLLIAAFGIWLGWQTNRANRQRAAVERVLTLGGYVSYDFQVGRYKGRYTSDPKAISRYPAWLMQLLGIHYFHRIVIVGLDGSKANDEDLLLLGCVSSIENLGLSRTQVTNDGLRYLKGLPNLQLLGLCKTRIDDHELKHLAGHTKMGSLALDETKVTDDGLVYLGGMIELNEWLSLSKTRVTDAGLEHLHSLKKLRNLILTDTQTSKTGRQNLRVALPNLNIWPR